MTNEEKDCLKGLTEEAVAQSRQRHGANLITPPAETPWWKLYFEKFKDPIILILIIAAAISLGFGIVHGDFTESVGIICTVILATSVGFWQEYSAKKKFDAMRHDTDYEKVKVRRDGEVVQVTKDMLVVGDVVLLGTGDEIPADIRLVKSMDMKVAEACMTGESVAVAKYPMDEAYTGAGYAPNLLLRGTTIEEGMGEGIVVSVGDATEIGKTTRQASEETHIKTPLEEKLERLAKKISAGAFWVAVTMFVVLNLVHWDFAFGRYEFQWTWDMLLQEVQFLMGAVVVVIVAVPEGLPLSVTLALAFSMKTMAKENNLIKRMHACETIGAVDTIFTDKTGTLTQNTMAVVERDVRDEAMMKVVGALNSTANWSKGNIVLGNPTEGAILKQIGREDVVRLRKDYAILSCIPFSSKNKYMVSLIADGSGHKTTIIKGAPEVVARIIGDDSFLADVATQQARGRRAITAAVLGEADYAKVKGLLAGGGQIKGSRYGGTWYIEDPVRSDVPEAVAKSYRAGIDVVMMTGDNLRTGSEIARQAGLKDIWAIEAKDFDAAVAEGNQQHGGRQLPNVIARCTPDDKLRILQWTRKRHHVCAMTGDGVNDSPSLNYADVGIAMGSGTSVAKEAADIVLLDDAFPSIITGVKWGRSLYKNIRNFLYLQLSINVSACLVAMLGPLAGVEMPFTVIQFLWINLVMDSLAAIALASEPADENVLLDRPRDRREFIINRPMLKEILWFGGTVAALCIAVLYGMEHHLLIDSWGIAWLSDLFDEINLTEFFVGYMVINWWNMFNARVMGRGKSAFSGLFSNFKFIGIMVLILLVTILMVQYGDEVMRTVPMSLTTWIVILAVTSPVVFLRELIRMKKNKLLGNNKH